MSHKRLSLIYTLCRIMSHKFASVFTCVVRSCFCYGALGDAAVALDLVRTKCWRAVPGGDLDAVAAARHVAEPPR
jgi:hypothetical protein